MDLKEAPTGPDIPTTLPNEEAFLKALTQFARDLATVSDLDMLRAFVAQRAIALFGADEGAVYLETRPLQSDSSPLALTLPLKDKSQVLGILTLARHGSNSQSGTMAPPQEFTQQDRRRLNLFTSIVAVAIAGLKREQAAQHSVNLRERGLGLFQETSRVIDASLALKPLTHRIINATMRALSAEAGMLALRDEENQLMLRAVGGAIPRDLIGIPLPKDSLLSWVAHHGRGAAVPEPQSDPRTAAGHPAQPAGLVVRGLLAAPLVSRGQVIGAIEVANKAHGPFDLLDLDLLEALAIPAAAAIANARLYERTQRQTLQQENIIRMGQAMSSAQDVDAVLQEVVESALSVIPAAFTAVVHLLDRDGTLQWHCDAGRPLWHIMKQPFSIGEGIAGHVFAKRELINVDDVLTEPRYVRGPGRTVYRSLLVAPLIVEGKPLGTLSVTGLEPNAFERDDEQMIRGLATQAAVALRNAQLLDSLRESEARYRGLVENANALLLIANPQGIITFAGGRWEEILGYTTEEVIGLSYQRLLHPADLEKIIQHTGKLRTAPAKVSNLTYRALHKDGSIRWNQISAVSTAGTDGQVQRIYAVVHDVTAQVEAEQSILRHAERLAALNTIASSISRSLDIDDIVHGGLQKLMDTLNMDAACLALLNERQTRLTPHTTIGFSSELLDFVTPLQSAEHAWPLQIRQPVAIPDLLADPRLEQYPRLPEIIRREGLRTLAAVPVIAQNENMGVLFVAARITDAISVSALEMLATVGQQLGVALHNAQLYAEAERRAVQLEEAYRKSQDLTRRKSQFIQNTSHELRTPLTFVRGYLELLLNNELGPLTEQQCQVLNIMNDKSLQLVELVNDIASLLDVELNPADIEPVDLVDVVAHSIMTQRRRAEQAGVTIETEWPDSPPIVYGSPTRLIQVFHHLLDNAIKFNCEGGRVTINLWHNGEQAYVRIADQGIGIPPEEQERIFDRFYQVDGSTTRRFGGTGLGLAIAKETIEAHKGKITVESSGIENEGAVFTIMLPLLKEQEIRSI